MTEGLKLEIKGDEESTGREKRREREGGSSLWREAGETGNWSRIKTELLKGTFS